MEDGSQKMEEGRQDFINIYQTDKSDMYQNKNFYRWILLMTGIILLLAIMGCSKINPRPPILILTSHGGFGGYTAEILKAEGFNEFTIDSIDSRKIDKSYLERFELVILAEQVTDLNVWEILRNYVKAGGNLIAFEPDSASADLFGTERIAGSISGGYISIDTSCAEGKALAGRRIQFHGIAGRYVAKSCKTIASFLSDSVAGDVIPSVVSNSFGNGHTVAFLYNLPENIVYTRQGNPLFAGIEKDSIPGLRAMDLFTDGWVDTTNNVINQADEQMVLLSHCIEKMSSFTKPLPRLWYFPDSLKCLVTLTNDGEYKGEADFEPQFRDVDSMGAKMSIYIIGVDKVSRAWADRWTARGFEIAGHPDDTKEAVRPTWNIMDSVIIAKKKEIADTYGLTMRTNVNHWFVWCGTNADGSQDFGAEARLEEKNGIEMDINYAKYDMKSNQPEYFLGTPGTSQGNYTGSGLVMKFADAKGQIINVYQHFNSVYDQEYNERHDPEGFFNCFKGLMDRSLNREVYSFISIKSHNDEYYFSKAPLMRMIGYANANKIPVWTALKLLDFLKMRDEASFTGIYWSGNKLSFSLNSSLKHSNGLTIMVPFRYNDREIGRISCNGKDAEFIHRSVKGTDYAFLTVTPGAVYSISVNYVL